MRISFGSVASLALCFTVSAYAAEPFDDKFRQLEEVLPTPNTYRTASGAPGHAYWQQRADYTIRATLDEAKREITGSGTITYHNHSPDTLGYLWVQLDQNIYKPDSDARRMATAPSRQAWARTAGDDTMKFEGMRSMLARGDFQGGFNIRALKGADGQPLKHVINRTMMRIDLPQPLKPGQDFVFQVDWDYRINEQKVLGGRAGYEVFDDKNALFEVAQWFPRMAAYYDAAGWQHKQFLGSGEFTLEFGDYDVQLTVPADHVVASTGELQNPQQVAIDIAQHQRQRRFAVAQQLAKGRQAHLVRPARQHIVERQQRERPPCCIVHAAADDVASGDAHIRLQVEIERPVFARLTHGARPHGRQHRRIQHVERHVPAPAVDVGDDQRQTSRVGNEACGHHERQRGPSGKFQLTQHGNHDRRQDQRRAVIGKYRRDGGAEQNEKHEQADTAAPAPARDVQGCPFKQASFFKQQADDDHGHERSRGIPDDVPHHRNVGRMDYASDQSNRSAGRSAPADAKAAWLPDHEDQGGKKN